MMIGTVMMSNQTSCRQSSLLAPASKHELSESEFSERTSVYARTKHKQYPREPPLPAMPPPSHSVLSMNEPTYDKPQQDKINVQILPMDDNWAETNTTANTADFSDFNDDMTEDARSSQFNFKHDQLSSNNHSTLFNSFLLFIQFHYGLISAILICACSFVTPLLFVLMPKLTTHWYLSECALECESTVIAIAFKLFILFLGNWTVFVRRPKSPLPRLNELRAILIFLLTIITFSYWLFYYVRILDTQLSDYYKILQFTGSYVDVLLFVFIISVFVLELRHLEARYVIKIVRSPDGQCREYTIGEMSIQKAAVCILEQYYRDFRAYNPWLEMAHKKRAAQLMQLEQINRRGGGDNADAESIKSRRSARNNRSSKSVDANYNLSAGDRLLEEYEYEKRLKKRKSRLFEVTEEAFSLIRRDFNIAGSQGIENYEKKTVMDPYDAAQAVFSSIARDLRRYLRITRQQPFFSRESIVRHLADCISYDMTPRSFLQRFVEGEAICFNERAMLLNEQRLVSEGTRAGDQTWILISDMALYQSLDNEVMFVLKQNEVSLMCSVKRLPRFNLIEDILDPKRNKFVLKVNSETTV